MLKQIAAGVLVHESEFLQSNAVVVQGQDGVLLIDPGITESELAVLANDIRQRGQPVVAGFATHPDCDHVLWHASFGDAPATARPGARRRSSTCGRRRTGGSRSPRGCRRSTPTDPDGAARPSLRVSSRDDGVPWDGPDVRIIEHQAHAPGHAALFIEERGVLVAGDMLSDIPMPFLDLRAADPVEDYLAALRLFESVADRVDAVVPGHGSVGGRSEVRARIDLDRAYVEAVRDGREPDDPRIGPSAPLYWLPDVHRYQVQRLAERAQSGPDE